MIKKLITDIVHNEITLSQALTKTKLISNRIKNETFKKWITNELEGYEHQDALLPEYRKIRCITYLKIGLPFGQSLTLPVSFGEEMDKDFLDLVLYYKATDSISNIEHSLPTLTTPKVQIALSPELAESLGRLFQQKIEEIGGEVQSGYLEIGKIHLINIIERTKQKLLDTLLELDEQFPNFESELFSTEQNKEKVQNIINNNYYGDNGTISTAAGSNVAQTINISVLKTEDETKLKSYGVADNEIDDLKKIIEDKHTDKSNFVEKAMKWLGSVSASVAAKGLYENIPAINDIIHKLII